MRWWRIKERDADLERELRSDLELEEEEQRESGVPPEEARNAARRAFGNTTLIHERTHETWGWGAVEHLCQDLRYALRQLKRYPGFTAVVVVVLGVGIGANCAIFSFVDAVFLRPLPVPHPEALVRIYARGPSGHYGAGFSYPEFEHLRDRISSLSAIAVENERPQLHLVLDDSSAEIRGNFVSANYFRVLGIKPHLGRDFLPEEDTVPGRDPVVVISDALWSARFNRDPAVLGRLISINSIRFKIVGVAPADFYGGMPGLPIDVWIPTMMYGSAGYACDDGTYNCSLIDQMIGSLAPGASMSQAQAEADSTMAWSAGNWLKRPGQRHVAIFSANRSSPEDQADHAAQLRLLMAVTASLLLIACANLAGLLLARGLTRRREIAVRLSIGAAGSRIVRQLLTETLMLAGLGGIAGLGLSLAGKKVLSDFNAMDREGFRYFYDLRFDWRTAAFSIGLTVVAGVFFGLLPAVRAVRQDLVTDLKDGTATEQHGKGRMRSMLVMGQIALSIVLVVASGLLMRSAAKIARGTNFEPENALVVRVRPELMKYTPQKVDALVRRVYQHLSAEPGVVSMAYMQGGEGLVWDWRSGRDAQVSLSAESRDQSAGLEVRKQDVSSGFFSTLKIPLLEGRGITEQDVAGSPPVAVINLAIAQRLWPGGSPAVGGTFYIDSKPFQIIGVCADLQPENPLYPPEPHVYLAYWQSNSTREGDVRLVLRVRDDPAQVLPRIRRVIQSIDASAPIGEDMPLAVQVRLDYMAVVMAQRVMTFCGLLALCLSAMGLYSILAFAVQARSLEIGIRMALGARKQDVLRMFFLDGVRLTLSGAAAGVVAAALSTRFLRALLYGVEVTDAGILLSAVGVLVLVALLACVLPASRAASISPIRVLRSE
jgi:macrolide transport system ATP-binding/permease protein